MKTYKKCLYLCIVTVITLSVLITLTSGFQYEYKKFKRFLITLIAVLLMRFIIWEHVFFAITALIKTKILRNKNKSKFKSWKGTDIFKAKEDSINTTMDLLKLRLKSLKQQLHIKPPHKDEAINLEYRLLTQEFWLFGKYFILVLLVIVYSRNPYGYYNTATIRALISEGHFTNHTVDEVNTLNQLYPWIEQTLAEGFTEGLDYDGFKIEEPGWSHFHLAKILGVVRLQQIRHANKTFDGMRKLNFDTKSYWPEWKPLNSVLHYTDKYWRIYYPWLSKQYKGIANWLMAYTHIGSLYSYSENNGYVALLARKQQNNDKILKFLKEHNWLDARTAAVFIDFTLYKIDSNIFTICSLLVEQTPFGNLIWHINIESSELLTNMNHLTIWRWFLIILYILQLIQFCKILIVKWWFSSDFFKSRWNWLDFIIVILNFLLFLFIRIREYYAAVATLTLYMSKKLEYVDFRLASVFDYMATIIMGFLVCLTSLRIWKILQFSSIFRIFNRTLYTSAGALFATVLGIHIFLFAIGLSAQIVNGSQTEIFSRYLKSVTSIMSFSFGFNSRTRPDDLSHGGGFLGFILYLILMFIVAIFLVNMFITLICDHFSNAREERDNQAKDRLTYWEFLKIEYSFVTEFFEKLFPRYYKRKNLTVSENIEIKVIEYENKTQDEKNYKRDLGQVAFENQRIEKYMLRSDHIQKVTAILQLQMEMLECLVQSLDTDSDEDADRSSKRS